MAIRLNGLCAGASGASVAVADGLAALLNSDVHPRVPRSGSVGAADLCLLAHVGLTLIGEGEAELGGQWLPSAEALARAGLAPVKLGPKDGLAICSSSAVSVATAALALFDARACLRAAQVSAALSMEGFRANLSPIDPRVHLFARPGRDADGHFNVLRGATAELAGVKVVGDFVGNHQVGLPSELALLLLMDPDTGVPVAILDATAITEMRTGAVTAIGAEHLARNDSRSLGHIGTRGTAYWNVRLLCHVLPGLQRSASTRAGLKAASASRTSSAPNWYRDVWAVGSWEQCARGADVIVEATRLTEPTPLLATKWIKPGSLVIPYGTVSAVALDLTEILDKIVVDDWGQAGIGPLGALRAHVDSGRLSPANLHAELGQIVCGQRSGREHDAETILFWHRGLSITDIALGQTLLDKARALGVGTRLPYRS
jgi:alanine dehydrogenase